MFPAPTRCPANRATQITPPSSMLSPAGRKLTFVPRGLGRPAMRIVQAVHWLQDMLPADSDSILKQIRKILDDPKHGATIRDDLRSGLDALPGWMRDLVTKLLQDADQSNTTARKQFSRSTN